MKKNFYTLIFLGLFATGIAQTGNVGINTTTPTATLDVNGNAKLRTTPNSTTLTGHQVLGIDTTTKEVKTLDSSLFTASSSTNTTIASASSITTGTLLGLTLNTGYDIVKFPLASVKSFSSNYNATTGVYTVPSNGIYVVKFNYRYGDGVQLNALSLTGGMPGIGVFRNGTQLEESLFSGANVSLLGLGILSVLISNTFIDSVYQFTAGDQITFRSNRAGLNLILLSDTINTSMTVYKISD